MLLVLLQKRAVCILRSCIKSKVCVLSSVFFFQLIFLMCVKSRRGTTHMWMEFSRVMLTSGLASTDHQTFLLLQQLHHRKKKTLKSTIVC